MVLVSEVNPEAAKIMAKHHELVDRRVHRSSPGEQHARHQSGNPYDAERASESIAGIRLASKDACT